MFLVPADLTAFATIDEAKAELMIEDAEAMAVLAAPCLADAEFRADSALVGVVKAILRGAILRWHDAGSGAVTQQGAGPFQQTVDTRTTRKGMFWPSEITQLRDLCAKFNGSDTGGAFTVDTAPRFGGGGHADICDLNLGWPYCSCGAYLARGEYPLYEGGVIS